MVSAAPLAFVVPVLAATVLVAGTQAIGRRLADAFAVTVAAATVALAALTLAHAWGHRAVYWFGGWQPRGRIAVGIGFVVDPLGGALAVLVAVLVLAALVYSWRYFEATAPLFHVLMLVFLAAMIGFSLTGDLFNMFVFFELMSVAAYALAGYKTEEKGPLQGALNFAISNSVGAFLTLSGIALVYARTGALNMAQAGEQLARHGHDGLVVVAFVLIISGFLVKAAAVPFHFWLADAHAVAPVPVCVLFSGVMVQLGLYGVARVYWTVFSGAITPASHALVAVLVVLGLIGAVVGAAMCFAEHHIKRLLAFSTISHTGLFLVGIALLGRDGAAATLLFVLAHAFVKGSLFMLAGNVGHRLESIDELILHGRGRALRWTGIGFALGGLALASMPPFGPFLGKGLLEEAAAHKGYGWVSAVFVLVSAVTGGAVLRVAGRVFLGLGPKPASTADTEATRDEPETEGPHRRTPAVMWAPAWLLMLTGLAVGVISPLRRAAATAAAALVDRRGYDADVIGRAGRALAMVPGKHPEALAYGLGALSTVLAIALAGLALGIVPSPFRIPRRARTIARRVELLHSGRIGDYIAWLTAGVGALGGAVALALH